MSKWVAGNYPLSVQGIGCKQTSDHTMLTCDMTLGPVDLFDGDNRSLIMHHDKGVGKLTVG